MIVFASIYCDVMFQCALLMVTCTASKTFYLTTLKKIFLFSLLGFTEVVVTF